jgi:hypothetical protein
MTPMLQILKSSMTKIFYKFCLIFLPIESKLVNLDSDYIFTPSFTGICI